MNETDENERVKNIVLQKVSDIVCAQMDLSDEAKSSLLSEYMKVFSKSWDAVLEAYAELLPGSEQIEQDEAQQKHGADPRSLLEEKSPDQPIEPYPVQIDEELEEAAITYEATLIATTRQRSLAPAKLSMLLGSSTRFASLTVKEQCVDLPHRPLIESTTLKNIFDSGCNKSTLRCDVQTRMEECESAVSDAALAVQSETERLDNIATALEIVSSNSSHPAHKLLSEIS